MQYRDEPSLNNAGDIVDFTGADLKSKSLKYIKKKGATGDKGTKNVEIKVRLKYLSNFWRNL